LQRKQLLCTFFLLVLSVTTLGDLTCAGSDPPNAAFVHTPVIPYVNSTVFFDASLSTSKNGHITDYEWDFGDASQGTGLTTTHVFMEAKNYTVTLTVTDSEGESATTSRLIVVILQPEGPAIDLYNQRGGQGLYEPDGVFAAGEEVDLVALLTYHGEPVQSKLVAFVVIDPIGETALDRTGITNSSGLATINFTIPRICLPKTFGTWIAAATASVSEQIVSDTLTFIVRGPILDIYTQKPEPYNGWGPDQPSDAFAPQEEVILYAYVSYSCEPVQSKPVAFEVIDPNNITIDARTAFTNEYGVANTSFRIPWPCENPEETIFGTWKAIAKVSILNQTAQDTITFLVGWIIEIIEVQTVNESGEAKTQFARGEHIFFNLTIQNIAMIRKIATFTIVIYDNCKVPIGIVVITMMLPPGESEVTVIVGIHVPKWTFIGLSTVYVNAYTKMPQLCGVPYCPEMSAMFTVTT